MYTRILTRTVQQSRRFSSSAAGFWARYDNFLKERPLLVKCVTSAGISLVADVVCQIGFSEAFLKRKFDEIEFDWKRLFKFTAIGGVFVAPILHFWYGLLALRIPGVTMNSVLKRLALDQLCFAPVFLAGFISLAMTLDGMIADVPAKLKADWFSTVVTNFSVWVPCQFVNFRFMPPHLQVLFANGVGFFWNIYLSYTCYNDDRHTAAHSGDKAKTDAAALALTADAKPSVEASAEMAVPVAPIVADVPERASSEAAADGERSIVEAEEVGKHDFSDITLDDILATYKQDAAEEQISTGGGDDTVAEVDEGDSTSAEDGSSGSIEDDYVEVNGETSAEADESESSTDE